VSALTINQTEITAKIAIEDQVLAHETHRLYAIRLKFAGSGSGEPMPPQNLSHRGSWPDLSQQLILSGIHFFLLQCSPLQI
jgi:hypothetical protein